MIFVFARSSGRADRVDGHHCVAVDQWFLPRLGAGQFYADRVRVLFAGEAARRIWLAHDWQGGVRGGAGTVDW